MADSNDAGCPKLSRLPDKYRVPIVLCDLEGKTIKEVVHQLGWPQGTVASRLTRGRALLARRLSKYGMTLSSSLLAMALTQAAASASVPAALTATTIQAACLFAAGKSAAAGGASATAVALTDGVLKTMLFVKLKLAVAVCLIATAFTAGVGGIAYTHLTADRSHQASRVRFVAQGVSPHHKADEAPTSLAKNDAVLEEVEPVSKPPKLTVELSTKEVKPGDVVRKSKIIVVRGPDPTACGVPPKAPNVPPASAPKPPQLPGRFHAYTVGFSPNFRSFEKLWVVLPRGQFVVVRAMPAPCPGTPQPNGAWHVVPDGKKLVIIGVPSEQQYSFTIRELPAPNKGATADDSTKWEYSATWSSDVCASRGGRSRVRRADAHASADSSRIPERGRLTSRRVFFRALWLS